MTQETQNSRFSQATQFILGKRYLNGAVVNSLHFFSTEPVLIGFGDVFFLDL